MLSRSRGIDGCTLTLWSSCPRRRPPACIKVALQPRNLGQMRAAIDQRADRLQELTPAQIDAAHLDADRPLRVRQEPLRPWRLHCLLVERRANRTSTASSSPIPKSASSLLMPTPSSKAGRASRAVSAYNISYSPLLRYIRTLATLGKRIATQKWTSRRRHRRFPPPRIQAHIPRACVCRAARGHVTANRGDRWQTFACGLTPRRRLLPFGRQCPRQC